MDNKDFLHTVLSPAEEKDLVVKFKSGDMKARDLLVKHNQKLILEIAKNFVGRGLDIEELMQEGNLGLLIALDKFDPKKGFKLSTYAFFWIKKYIFKSLAQQGSLIRMPLHIQETKSKVDKVWAARCRDEDIPDQDKLSELTGFSKKRLDHCQMFSIKPVSLDDPIQFEQGIPASETFLDMLSDKETVGTGSVEKIVEDSLMINQLYWAMLFLSPEEYHFIKLRFGLMDGVQMTYPQLEKIFDKCSPTLKKYEVSIVNKLKGYLGIKDKRKVSIQMQFDKFILTLKAQDFEIAKMFFGVGQPCIEKEEIAKQLNMEVSEVLERVTQIHDKYSMYTHGN